MKPSAFPEGDSSLVEGRRLGMPIGCVILPVVTTQAAGGASNEPCVALVPLFARLTPEQQADVATFAKPVQLERGEMFVRAGQPGSSLFVVHAGQVKFVRTTADGQETILQVLGPGEVGGETWLLTGARPDSDVTALEPARMCVFDDGALTTLMRRFPAIGMAMLRTLAQRLNATERMLAARTLTDVGARLSAYLLDCPTTWGENGMPTAHLPMTKKNVATFLGTTAETLSRRLAGLERDGLVRVRGADIDILDVAGLDQRSRGA